MSRAPQLRFTLRSLLFLAILLATPLVACSKPDAPTVQSDPAKLQTEPSASAPVASASTPAWAEPAQLCVHTVAVCQADESCAGLKTKLNASGIHAYQLFDVDCLKSLVKRQTVLGEKYEACAVCLRDANEPKSVQACMFAGGVCHGT